MISTKMKLKKPKHIIFAMNLEQRNPMPNDKHICPNYGQVWWMAVVIEPVENEDA